MSKGPAWKFARQVRLRLLLLALRWRWFARNRHNETSPVNVFDIDRVSVGEYSYGPLRVIDGGGYSHLTIGSHCSIAEDVTFVLSGEHHLHAVTTLPLRTFVLGEAQDALSNGNIDVEDDVWIGHGAIVLSGVRLARGSVIAAGAVVAHDTAPYSVVGGVPARQISTRVAAEMVSRVQQLDLTLLSPALVADNIELLEHPLDEETIRTLEGLLRRAP